MVSTAIGDVAADSLGSVLMHEHVFLLTPELDLAYADIVGWDEKRRMDDAVTLLKNAKDAGVDTIVDLTVIGQGRDVRRVREISERSGVTIVVATGLYTFDALPKFLQNVGPGSPVRDQAVDPMVEMFVRDVRTGIGHTRVRAGILKCATDEAGVTPGVERVLRAVARTSVETGVPISTHTHAQSHRGLDQIEIFRSEGVDMERVIIGHSGDSTDYAYLSTLADHGVTLGMDRFGLYGGKYSDFDTRVDVVAAMCHRGYADRMVLSHDASAWMDWLPLEITPGTSMDMPDWRFDHIHTAVLPALSERGVTDDQIAQMLVLNPARLLTPAPR